MEKLMTNADVRVNTFTLILPKRDSNKSGNWLNRYNSRCTASLYGSCWKIEKTKTWEHKTLYWLEGKNFTYQQKQTLAAQRLN